MLLVALQMARCRQRHLLTLTLRPGRNKAVRTPPRSPRSSSQIGTTLVQASACRECLAIQINTRRTSRQASSLPPSLSSPSTGSVLRRPSSPTARERGARALARANIARAQREGHARASLVPRAASRSRLAAAIFSLHRHRRARPDAWSRKALLDARH